MKINANELLIFACVLQNLVLQVSNDLWLQELSPGVDCDHCVVRSHI